MTGFFSSKFGLAEHKSGRWDGGLALHLKIKYSHHVTEAKVSAFMVHKLVMFSFSKKTPVLHGNFVIYIILHRLIAISRMYPVTLLPDHGEREKSRCPVVAPHHSCQVLP